MMHLFYEVLCRYKGNNEYLFTGPVDLHDIVSKKKNSRVRREGFPDGAVLKNPPANAGHMVRALVWEDPTCRRPIKPVHHNY